MHINPTNCCITVLEKMFYTFSLWIYILNVEPLLVSQYWSEGHSLNNLEYTCYVCLLSNITNCIITVLDRNTSKQFPNIYIYTSDLLHIVVKSIRKTYHTRGILFIKRISYFHCFVIIFIQMFGHLFYYFRISFPKIIGTKFI